MRALVVVLVLAACAGPAAEPDPTGGTPTTAATTTTTVAAEPSSPAPATIPEVPPVTGETPTDILDPILADAAERSGVPVDALEVVRSEFVEWPDGSLGCPEPGMYYTQVITPGYWVQVEAGGTVLDYRAGTKGFFRLCETPSKGVPPGSNPDA